MSYRIADEPRPSPLSHLVVQPFWPLLGLMFGGFWLAVPWFVFNSIAVGSPRRGREIATAILGVIVALALAWAILVAESKGFIASSLHARLALLLLLAWKITICYALCILQSRSFSIYTYYGGIARNGMLVVAAAWFLGPKLWSAVDLPTLVAIVVR